MKKTIGSVLSEDWQPSDGDREYGRALPQFLTDEQIDSMAEDMRLWAGANANRQIARKANWSLAFKGWMRREAKRMKGNGYERAGQNRAAYNGRSPPSHADAVLAGMGRVAARYDGTNDAAGPENGTLAGGLRASGKKAADH